jgi:hypothetical protein
MNIMKILSLAIVAALSLLASVGGGTAWATTLFTDSAKTIDYPAGTTINASIVRGTSSSLKSGSTMIATCTGGAIHGKTATTTGAGVRVNIESATWEGCSQTTHTLLNGSLVVASASGADGEVTGKETQWTYAMFGTSCTYGFGEGVKLGTLTGSSPAVLKINTLIPRVAGGFLCPSTTTWQAEYAFTSPHALYVGS